MTELLYFGVCILGIVLAIGNANSFEKYYKLLALVILVLIMGTVHDIPDYTNYERMFYNSSYLTLEQLFDIQERVSLNTSRDIAYAIVNYFGNCIGLDYPSFKLITSAIFLTAIVMYIKKYKVRVSFVIALYVLYPFFMDTIQVRNSIIELAVLIAMYYHAQNERIKAVAVIFLSGLFHGMGWILLPFFLLYNYIRHKKGRAIFYIGVGLGGLTPLYSDYMLNNWSWFAMLLTSDATSFTHFAQYAESITFAKYIYCYVYLIMLIITAIFIERFFNGVEKIEFYRRLSVDFKNLSMYLMCLVPLTPLFTELGRRDIRDVLLVFYILLARVMYHVNWRWKIVIAGFGCGMALLFGRIELYQPDLRPAVTEIIESNIFGSFFSEVLLWFVC